MTRKTKTRLCAFCLKPAEGNYTIHRDGFGVGPEVDICDAHGGDREPSCAEIWDRIALPSSDRWAHRRVPLSPAVAARLARFAVRRHRQGAPS